MPLWSAAQRPRRAYRGPWWRKLIRRGTMQEERKEREQYMDSLKRQMEEQREQIQRTLERTTED
jgi:hypothetical protein